MTLDPECGACGKDYDLQVFDHIPSNNPIVLCLSCASHEMMRESARGQYRFKGTYIALQARVTDELLENYLGSNPHAAAAAEGMTATELHMRQEVDYANRIEFGVAMEKWIVANPDNILDEYIDSHPEQFPDAAPVVAQTDNELGEAVWAEMRMVSSGG